jgi:hypothetical protein
MSASKTTTATKKPASRRAEDFLETFDQLRSILKKYEPQLTLKVDKPDNYYLDAAYSEKWKKVLFFASVQIRKNYVSYYFMPIYMCDELQAAIPDGLKKRMQGKACFNFTRIEPSQARELAQLTRKGFDKWKKLGWI